MSAKDTLISGNENGREAGESFVPINKGQFALEPPERVAEFEKKRGFGVMDDYLENRRQWEEYPKKQFVSDYPLHVDVEIASLCNLNCPMCYTITPEFKEKVNVTLMDFDLYCRIIDQCAEGNVFSIRLSFRGEAFLHDRVVDCIRYAKDKGIKEVSSLTHGYNIDEEKFKKIMEAGLDWLTISFDGMGEVYEKIRYPAKFERAVEKIANYAEMKKEANRVKPVIKVQSILPAIENDLDAYYRIFAPITDMVSANPLIDFMQSKRDMPKIPNFTCPQIYQRLVIGADGLCMMCTNDVENRDVIGDANKQSIHEIWHGAEMSRVRRMHADHTACGKISACADCYLPIQTEDGLVKVGDRNVVASKYLTGIQRVNELKTPEKYKRQLENI